MVSWVGDGLDSGMSYRGSKDFWLDMPEDYDRRYSEGRECTNCGDPVTDAASGDLCHACRNMAKSDKVQALVRQLVRRAAEQRIAAWFANVRPRQRLRVVGIELWDERTKAAWKQITSS